MAIDYQGGILGQLGGALGLTDPAKGKRALSEITRAQNDANKQLDFDTSEGMQLLRNAAKGRSFEENLDAYDSAFGNVQSQLANAGGMYTNQMNAGNSANVQQYLNPQMQQMLDNTMQRVQGGAGSALQSSATNRNAANAVAQQAGNMWQQAFQNAMGDSQNNINIANAYGNNALAQGQLLQQKLNNDNAPMEDYLQLGNDKAMQRYAGNIALGQAGAQMAGSDQSLLSGLLGG